MAPSCGVWNGRPLATALHAFLLCVFMFLHLFLISSLGLLCIAFSFHIPLYISHIHFIYFCHNYLTSLSLYFFFGYFLLFFLLYLILFPALNHYIYFYTVLSMFSVFLTFLFVINCSSLSLLLFLHINFWVLLSMSIIFYYVFHVCLLSALLPFCALFEFSSRLFSILLSSLLRHFTNSFFLDVYFLTACFPSDCAWWYFITQFFF